MHLHGTGIEGRGNKTPGTSVCGIPEEGGTRGRLSLRLEDRVLGHGRPFPLEGDEGRCLGQGCVKDGDETTLR